MKTLWKLLPDKVRKPFEKWWRNMKRAVDFIWKRAKLVFIIILGLGFLGGYQAHSFKNSFLTKIAEFAARDPDGLYQMGEKICTIQNPTVDTGHSEIFFKSMNCSQKPDLEKSLEYRDKVIVCNRTSVGFDMTMGGETAVTKYDVTCKITGKRE